MKQPARRSFWRTCRVYFRRLRITGWLLILGLVGGLIYLNQVGLPDLIKQPLLDKLYARGFDLEFSRLRLRWYEGIVAEDVRFGRAADVWSPRFTAKEVQVRLNPVALARMQVQVDALLLKRGRFVWSFEGADRVSRQLTVENIRTELRLLPGDRWELDDFRADFGGAKLRLSGVITNASAVREWSLLRAQGQTPAGTWRNRLRGLADALDQIQFATTPELSLRLEGDARDLQSFTLGLKTAAVAATTPWGTISNGVCSVRLLPAEPDKPISGELEIRSDHARTPWAEVGKLHLNIFLVSGGERADLVNGTLALNAQGTLTPWAGGSNLVLRCRWTHSVTNPVPLSGSGEMMCVDAWSKWGHADKLRISGRLLSSVAGAGAPRKLSGWWTNLEPYHFEWSGDARGLAARGLEVEKAIAAGSWQSPRLAVSNFQARLYQGDLEARGLLDASSREAQWRISSTFDPRRVNPILSEGGRRWLGQFSWNRPPRLHAELSAILPAWTNSQPDWKGEVRPTLRLNGRFDLTEGGAYRGIHVDTAGGRFAYSNSCWLLTDLRLAAPQANIQAVHRASDITRDYYWRLRGSVDPRLLLPILKSNETRAVSLVSLSQPAAIDGEVWGRFHDYERLGAKGRIAATNFSFRGQWASGLQARFAYTNRLLQVFEPRVQRGTQHLSADGLAADFLKQRVYLTNGFGTAEPLAVARAIGPKIGKRMEDYVFTRPPAAHVFGTIPMRGKEGADLHFDIDGGPFHWWKFHVPRIAGRLRWHEDHLILSDVRVDFYNGKALGNAELTFSREHGTDFRFTMNTTNTLLQLLIPEFSTKGSQAEGWVDGTVVVTEGNSRHWSTVQGYGAFDFHNGMIWDIPLFGIFSPILNSISPGLGNSRATDGTCTFMITNGIVRTDNLDIRTPTMRLQYRGDVDLESRVNARVEAEVLRDIWLVGPIVSTVLWPVTKMFEYKVTGTLSEPKLEPVYLFPKLVLLPFAPLRGFKDLFPGSPGPPVTNSIVEPTW